MYGDPIPDDIAKAQDRLRNSEAEAQPEPPLGQEDTGAFAPPTSSQQGFSLPSLNLAPAFTGDSISTGVGPGSGSKEVGHRNTTATDDDCKGSEAQRPVSRPSSIGTFITSQPALKRRLGLGNDLMQHPGLSSSNRSRTIPPAVGRHLPIGVRHSFNWLPAMSLMLHSNHRWLHCSPISVLATPHLGCQIMLPSCR